MGISTGNALSVVLANMADHSQTGHWVSVNPFQPHWAAFPYGVWASGTENTTCLPDRAGIIP